MGGDTGMDAARGRDRRPGRAPALGRLLAVMCGFALALCAAAPAWASVEATGTYAPDSANAGGWVVTLTNTGTEPITAFAVTTLPVAKLEQIDPSPACKPDALLGVTIECKVTIDPKATTHLCYRGTGTYPSDEKLYVYLNGSQESPAEISQASPTSCPSSTGTGGSGGGSGSGGSSGSGGGGGAGSGSGSGGTTGNKTTTHHWSAHTCRVNYDAWSKKHRHATRSKKKAEAKALNKEHGCSVNIWK